LKRGTKSLGKRSEFEALVQVKQTVNHSETTARSKFQKNKEKSLVDPSGGGETAGTLFFQFSSFGGHLRFPKNIFRTDHRGKTRTCEASLSTAAAEAATAASAS
jgi:hypothetical protein